MPASWYWFDHADCAQEFRNDGVDSKDDQPQKCEHQKTHHATDRVDDLEVVRFESFEGHVLSIGKRRKQGRRRSRGRSIVVFFVFLGFFGLLKQCVDKYSELFCNSFKIDTKGYENLHEPVIHIS